VVARRTPSEFSARKLFAHQTLTLYETATGPNKVDVYLVATRCDNSFQADDIVSDSEYARRFALKEVMKAVEWVVGETCSPALYRDGDRVVQGWRFGSLLGAM
jgi:hypothetical protein